MKEHMIKLTVHSVFVSFYMDGGGLGCRDLSNAPEKSIEN